MTTMVKRAGMVQGMPEWQRRLMSELEQALGQNRGCRIDGETLKQAERSMGDVINEMDKACDAASEAAELLKDTPHGDRIASILSDMESTLDYLKQLKEMFMEGDC